jgi:type VI secretion system Hcp family effector
VHRVVPVLVGLLLGAPALLSAQATVSAQAKVASAAARTHPTIYVDIKGAKQLEFPGDAPPAELKAHPHEIAAFSLGYEVEAPHNAQTGQLAGRHMHKPVVFTHDVSVATPAIFQALVTNEALTTVTITVMKVDPNGVTSAHYTMTLTNAHVVSLRQFNEENQLLEEVSLTFQKIEIRVGTKTAMDDWSM